ncbi:phage tail tape measure protein, partial [Streptomyces sp. RK75]
MRTALRSLKPARLATTGLTALGAAGIATTALAGTAHAAQAPAKPATKPAAVAHAHDAKAKADAKAKDEKKDEKKAGGKEYADNLDGWIREARAIMNKHDIPGSYEGIKRNIIRESAGDPNAVNDWDIN